MWAGIRRLVILSVSQLSSSLPGSLAPQFWGKQIRAAVSGAPAAPWSFPGEIQNEA